MKLPSFLKAFSAALLLTTSPSSGSTIFWSSEFNDLLFTSTGQPLDETFVFEIGTFANGFIPTFDNSSEWEANWQVFDRAFDPDAEGWNAQEQFFTATVEHNALGGSESPDANPSDVFTQGSRAFLWVYNSKAIVPGSEWALVTDSNPTGNLANQWLFPDPAEDSSVSYDWRLIDADEAIVGGVNGTRGEGDFSVDPGVFSLQTHVIPEPGSALLLLIAAGALLRHRAGRARASLLRN